MDKTSPKYHFLSFTPHFRLLLFQGSAPNLMGIFVSGKPKDVKIES